MAVLQQTSADNLLSLLGEEDAALKHYALDSLNKVVHDFWFQISSSLATVESFYEDEGFKHRELAALVASKVFYHLGELEDALTYALGAGSLFNLNEKSDYVQALLAKCLDQYTAARVAAIEANTVLESDPRLVAIVERMFDRCYQDGQYEQAVGLALDVCRLDKLEEAITRSSDQAASLTYALKTCQQTVINRGFRQEVLRLLVRLCRAAEQPDWVNICQCLMFLDSAPEVATILHDLLNGSESDALLAYQVGFDLYENEMQSFLQKVYEVLDFAPKPAHAPHATSNGDIPAVPAETATQPAATEAPPAAAPPTPAAAAAPADGPAPAAADAAAAPSRMDLDGEGATENGDTVSAVRFIPPV